MPGELISRLLPALITLLAMTTYATAHQIVGGDLVIGHPYTVEPADGVRAVDVYMTIRNTSTTPDRLTGVACALAGATALEIDTEPKSTDGASSQVAGVDIGGLQEVALGPRGIHIRLRGLNGSLAGYLYFPMSLIFERAGKVDIEVMVEDRN